MAKDICAATGERIRTLRRAKGWRQIDLAEHSGVHEVHISDLERGTREPRLRTLSKIVTALGTTLSEMLRGTVTPARAVDLIANRPDSECVLENAAGLRVPNGYCKL
jgi:transcriptional regulator with XRE-family HTH domain